MKIRVGIILKKYFPQKRKLVMLDKELGKIECIPTSEDLCCGILLYYHLQQQPNGVLFMKDVERIGLPLFLAQHDLLFFHHVLELCYYYVVSHTDSTELFRLLSFLYQPEDMMLSYKDKRLFLVKFFMLLGFYPEDKKFQRSSFYHIGLTSIDILVKQDLDLGIEKELDAWLRGCVSSHPIEKFKTMHFLDESRLT